MCLSPDGKRLISCVFERFRHYCNQGQPQVSVAEFLRLANAWDRWLTHEGTDVEPDVEKFIETAGEDEQNIFLGWIQSAERINSFGSQLVSELVLAQLAFLGPFREWPTLAKQRASGIAGVHVDEDAAKKWSRDDLVRWRSFVVDSQLPGHGGAEKHSYHIVGETFYDEQKKTAVAGVDPAIKAILGGKDYWRIFWRWYFFHPRLRGSGFFHLRHPLSDISLMALVCGIVLLGPFGYSLSQRGIHAGAEVLLLASFGLPLAMAWTAWRNWRDGKSRGNKIIELLNRSALCCVCGGTSPERTLVEGRSFELPLSLSLLFSLCRHSESAQDKRRKNSIWDDIGNAMEKHVDGTCATGEVESSGAIETNADRLADNYVDRLKDKHAVASANDMKMFICPPEPDLGKRDLPAMKASHLAEAVMCVAWGGRLEAFIFPKPSGSASQWSDLGKWCRFINRRIAWLKCVWTGLRCVLWPIMLLALWLDVAELWHLAWPPQAPHYAGFQTGPITHYAGLGPVVSPELTFKFHVANHSSWFASYYSSSWQSLPRTNLIGDSSQSITLAVGPSRNPAASAVRSGGLPGAGDLLILERCQRFLAWNLPPVRAWSKNGDELFFPDD